MISHKHKCIFIHIPKCAGTSIEHAFGINTEKYNKPDFKKLFGWSESNQIWLQHATPQQLIDNKLLTEYHWKEYYKFIVYRNTWSRSYSDYIYLKDRFNLEDTFENYLNRSGDFYEILDFRGNDVYVGDHLNKQKDYFFLNNNRINYDQEINFNSLKDGLKLVCRDLYLPDNFFNYKLNSGPKRKHYSFFYDNKKKELVRKLYFSDIEFFNFEFIERKNWFEKVGKEFISFLKS